MKRLIALLLTSLCLLSAALADPQLELRCGGGWLGAGSTFSGDFSQKALGTNFAFSAGAECAIPFAGSFAVQTGLDFFYGSLAADYDGAGERASFSYAALDVPLLLAAKYRKWTFLAGPYLSLPLYLDASCPDAGLSVTRSTSVNAGLCLGVGYAQRMGSGALSLSARYQLDLRETAFDYMAAGTRGSAGFTRRGIFLGLALRVPLSSASAGNP